MSFVKSAESSTLTTDELACRDCPLRRQSLFCEASDSEIALIQRLKNGEMWFDRGDDLIAEGAEDARLFTILEGWAFRFKTLPDGRRQILSFLLPGDFVGLQQKMDDLAAHGVQALTPLRVCHFRRDALWTIHREAPSLGYDVTWLAAHGERVVDDNLLSVGQRSAKERVASLLLWLWSRQLRHEGSTPRDGLAVSFPLTQQHIADAMGLSLVHTNRTLRDIEREGWVSWQASNQMAVQKGQRLAALAHLPWPLEWVARPLI